MIVILFPVPGQHPRGHHHGDGDSLSMLFTFTGMVHYKVSANLMSLGALDRHHHRRAVVIVENCVRRLAHAQAHYGRPLTRAERFHEVFLASAESRRALLFGQLIIMVVYLPIFALTGGREDVPPDGVHGGGRALGP